MEREKERKRERESEINAVTLHCCHMLFHFLPARSSATRSFTESSSTYMERYVASQRCRSARWCHGNHEGGTGEFQ